MRAFIYILICSVLLSCSDVNNKEMIVKSAADVKEETAAPISSETFQYETITKQKLQELLDLKVLAQAHPEDSVIKTQLAAISQSTVFTALTGAQNIITIEALEKPEIINDSVQKLYVLVTAEKINGAVVKDSITAIITSRTFILDGVEQISTKVVFEELD